MGSKRVALWTAPRCVGTAFERSITTLSKTKVFHEPYGMAFYFGPERQSDRYLSEPIHLKESYDNISKMLLQDYNDVDVVFFKEMAYSVENKFDMFAEERFKELNHTFLIRDPSKSIASLYRLSTNPELTGWSYFEQKEAGFRQMYELYNFITENIHPNPVVVDADDLLDHPDQTMKSYCDATGITYEAHMTTWESGLTPQWQFWPKGWYETVLKSKGFQPRNKKPASSEALKSLPQEVKRAIENEMPYYESLAAKRIRPHSPDKQDFTSQYLHHIGQLYYQWCSLTRRSVGLLPGNA